MSQKITTVVFDLGEVVLTGMKGIGESIGRQLNVDSAIIDRQCRCAELEDLFHGKIQEVEYWNVLIQRHGWSVDQHWLQQAIRNNFKEIEGVKSIIETLRRKKYKLGLLSIHAREWVDFCHRTFGHHDLFDAKVYSFDIAVSKPAAESYQAILKELQAKPEESIFIDDKLRNVEAARRLGMTGIVFQHAQQLERDLLALYLL